MSRKVIRKNPLLLVREVIDPEHAVIRRAPLTGGGELISEPDVQTYLVAVSCNCGLQVAALFSNDRKERTGKPAFYFLQTQVIVDPLARPVVTQMFETVLDLDTSIETDCQAHGRQSIDVASLFKHARKMETRLAKGGEKMQEDIALGKVPVQKFILPRVVVT